MACNKITKPDFTKKQISECDKCKHLSRRKIWCGLFGVFIREPEKQKIIYPSLPKMGMNLAKATGRHIADGMKKRSDEEVAKLVLICETCDDYIIKTRIGSRCRMCGCKLSVKLLWASAHCPVGKW